MKTRRPTYTDPSSARENGPLRAGPGDAELATLQLTADGAPQVAQLARLQAAAPDVSSNMTLQGMFGFELELAVPIWTGDSVETRNEAHLGKDLHIHEGKEVHAVEDHIKGPGWTAPQSIVEIVTSAKDEFDPKALNPMMEAKDLADRIGSATNGLTKHRKTSEVFSPGVEGVSIGLTGTGADAQSLDANVQATYAVSPEALPELMHRIARKDRGPETHERKDDYGAKVLTIALERASIVMGQMKAAHAPNLAALVHLLTLYLVAGDPKNAAYGRLDKNYIPFLIRHSLATLRNRLKLTPAEGEFLADDGRRGKLIDTLLKATARGAGELLLPFSKDVTAGAWLEGVLTGTADPMPAKWGLMRNIDPEPVGPKDDSRLGIVGEERTIPPPEGRVGLGNAIPPGQWMTLAKNQMIKLQELNRKRPLPPSSEGASASAEGSGEPRIDIASISDAIPSGFAKPTGKITIEKTLEIGLKVRTAEGEVLKLEKRMDLGKFNGFTTVTMALTKGTPLRDGTEVSIVDE
ncbi:MAG: hypothetical protein AAFU59_13270 [Pseudomonadota bacterium]